MDKAAFAESYLASRRAAEIAQFKALADSMAGAPNAPWLMTLMTKQDLWWHDRRAVRARYETGPYNAALDPVRRAKGDANVRYEIVEVALTWENLTDPAGTIVVPTASGYDRAARLEGVDRLHWTLAQWAGIEI